MAEMSLAVDGRALPLYAMEFLFQANPYPGGSQYLLRIADEDFSRIIRKRFGVGTYTDLGAREVGFVFMELRGMKTLINQREWKHSGRVSLGPPLFWANTIAGMSLSPPAVVLSGVCSPHLG